jgi:hypothetical protein
LQESKVPAARRAAGGAADNSARGCTRGGNYNRKSKGGKCNMNEKDFVRLCKEIVADYANKHLDKTDGKKITTDDVFVVWMCKTLQNSKALASTTLFDGMYYELTYNGDKGELYFDAYKKWENICLPVYEVGKHLLDV